MTTLVTGGAGFIGGHAIDEIVRRGEPVRALVRQESQAEALRQHGADVVVGDICDAAAVRRAVEGVQVVQHCAAAVGPSYTHEQVYDINLGGVRNVLDALKQAGRGRLVLVSSINVLGS
ncbi:MAG: NAD(P)H-binding protein, partial [Pirellulales bacterium]